MDKELIELLRQRAARLTPEIQRAVWRRAGGRCEGWIDDGRMKYSERCTACGDNVDFYVNF
jgi:hypothetical protein